MDEIKIARLENLLYNVICSLQEEFENDEDTLIAWLDLKVGLRKVEYERLMKGESIC